MSNWTDAMTDQRIAEARGVYDALDAKDPKTLTPVDRALLAALGYLCLEIDDVNLASLTNAL